MGSTNYGDQIKTFDYLQEGTSEGFNKLLHGVIPTGIISGGVLGKTSDTQVTLSPTICYISDPTRKISVRVETTNIANITVSAVTPFVVFRMDWINIENNYMDVLALAEDEIENGDLVVGRCVFSGATLSNTFDYSWRNNHPFIELLSTSNAFKISATDPYTNTVNITSGVLYFNSKKVTYSGGVSPAFSPTDASNSRIDLLCIDDSGILSIEEGVADPSPVTPDFPYNKLVLAIITIPVSKSIIEGSFIEELYYDRYVDNYIKALSDLTTHASLTTAHGAVSAATAERIIIRDSNGRARIADPDDNGDIANKGYVVSQAGAFFKQYGLGVNTDPGEAIVTNADTASTVGFYRLPSGSTGNPFANDASLNVYRNGAGQVCQEATDPTVAITTYDSKQYRYYSGSAWSAWSRFLNGSEFDAYINQSVKTTDSVTFAQVNSANLQQIHQFENPSGSYYKIFKEYGALGSGACYFGGIYTGGLTPSTTFKVIARFRNSVGTLANVTRFGAYGSYTIAGSYGKTYTSGTWDQVLYYSSSDNNTYTFDVAFSAPLFGIFFMAEGTTSIYAEIELQCSSDFGIQTIRNFTTLKATSIAANSLVMEP